MFLVQDYFLYKGMDPLFITEIIILNDWKGNSVNVGFLLFGACEE